MERKLAAPLVQRDSPRRWRKPADMAGPSMKAATKLNWRQSIYRTFAMFAQFGLGGKSALRTALLAVTANGLDTLQRKGLGHANAKFARLDKNGLDQGRGRQPPPAQLLGLALIEVIHQTAQPERPSNLKNRPHASAAWMIETTAAP